MYTLDRLFEKSSRSLAQRTSRRSFVAVLGQVLTGSLLLPLLPIDRVNRAEAASPESGAAPPPPHKAAAAAAHTAAADDPTMLARLESRRKLEREQARIDGARDLRAIAERRRELRRRARAIRQNAP